jgi:transcriptional regulator with XRE-family HTH domain
MHQKLNTHEREFYKRLGDNLRYQRLQRGITTSHIAKATESSKEYVQRIERGVYTSNVIWLSIYLQCLDIRFNDVLNHIRHLAEIARVNRPMPKAFYVGELDERNDNVRSIECADGK